MERRNSEAPSRPDAWASSGAEPPAAGWQSPALAPRMLRDQVHIWRIDLEMSTVRIQLLASTLSDTERCEAAVYAKGRQRSHFVGARGAVRSILSKYAGIEPAQLILARHPGGKPYLVEAMASSPIRFNVSHSHNMALCAVALEREVGVDVERIRPLPSLHEMANRYLSAHEYDEWVALRPDMAVQGFLTAWTRKEACSKALGQGISQCWSEWDLSLHPGTRPQIVEIATEQGNLVNIELSSFILEHEYVAAVAVQGWGHELRTWRWECPDEFCPG